MFFFLPYHICRKSMIFISCTQQFQRRQRICSSINALRHSRDYLGQLAHSAVKAHSNMRELTEMISLEHIKSNLFHRYTKNFLKAFWNSPFTKWNSEISVGQQEEGWVRGRSRGPKWLCWSNCTAHYFRANASIARCRRRKPQTASIFTMQISLGSIFDKQARQLVNTANRSQPLKRHREKSRKIFQRLELSNVMSLPLHQTLLPLTGLLCGIFINFDFVSLNAIWRPLSFIDEIRHETYAFPILHRIQN